MSLIDTVHAKGLPLVQVYGATETGPIAIYQRAEMAIDTAGSIGRAGLLCDIKLINNEGDEVATNETGEICVRGDNILTHYWKNPRATKQTIADGWFRTGDIARVDDDGNYWFADRLKHVIISGGENIYPAEIERIIQTLPGIVEVSVVGKPHQKWGEVPVVVAVTDQKPVEARQSIVTACRENLAKYKTPHDVLFVPALPRNPMGKVVNNQVRDLYLQQCGDSCAP